MAKQAAIYQIAYHDYVTNPKTIRKHLVAAGCPREEAAEAAQEVLRRQAERAKKQVARRALRTIDPLAWREPGHAARTVQTRQAEAKRQADEAVEAMRRREWADKLQALIAEYKPRRTKARLAAEQAISFVEWENPREAYPALLLECFTKHVLKSMPNTRRGHWSRVHGGNSVYIEFTDRDFMVRLSDHDLPDTPERMHRRDYLGEQPSWNAEIVVSSSDDIDSLEEELKERLEVL